MIFARDARKLTDETWTKLYGTALIVKLQDIENRIKDACERTDTFVTADIDHKIYGEVYKSLITYGYSVKIQHLYNGRTYQVEISWSKAE
jgi:hypothetical protein